MAAGLWKVEYVGHIVHCGIADVMTDSKDLGQYNPMVLPVKADNARDMYQDGIGAHPSQSRSLDAVRVLIC